MRTPKPLLVVVAVLATAACSGGGACPVGRTPAFDYRAETRGPNGIPRAL